MIDLIMVLSGRTWILALWIWEAMECFKWQSMGSHSGNIEDIIGEINLNCADKPGTGCSLEKNFSMWSKDCFCGCLGKNVVASCPCLKSLPEANLRDLY